MPSSVAADVTVVVAPDALAMVHCSSRAVSAALVDNTVRTLRKEPIEGIAPRENAPARTEKRWFAIFSSTSTPTGRIDLRTCTCYQSIMARAAPGLLVLFRYMYTARTHQY